MSWLWDGDNFLNRTQNTLIIEENVDKLDYIELKIFSLKTYY